MRRWGPKREAVPSLTGLIAVEAAARLGSFGAAAREMGLTQGAVAQKVRGLEAQFGFALFERRPRALVPTPACLAYAEAARAALGDLGAATRTLVESASPEPTGHVVVSASPSFAARWLIPRLERFARAHPGVAVRIDATEQPRPLAGPDAVDLAIRWGVAPFAGARAERLLPAALQAVCTPELQRRHSFATPADLVAAPLIGDTHDLWDRWLVGHGVAPDAIDGPRVTQTALAIEAAVAGLGVALAPRVFVAEALATGTLVPAIDGFGDIAVEAGFHLLRAERRAPGRAVSAMRDWLLAEARDALSGDTDGNDRQRPPGEI
ncbi:MAG: LysR substrate-binding domain-containing protein [Azospirillaceae bacterium]